MGIAVGSQSSLEVAPVIGVVTAAGMALAVAAGAVANRVFDARLRRPRR